MNFLCSFLVNDRFSSPNRALVSSNFAIKVADDSTIFGKRNEGQEDRRTEGQKDRRNGRTEGMEGQNKTAPPCPLKQDLIGLTYLNSSYNLAPVDFQDRQLAITSHGSWFNLGQCFDAGTLRSIDKYAHNRLYRLADGCC